MIVQREQWNASPEVAQGRDPWGLIPGGDRFLNRMGYEAAQEVHGWEWATTFGRWSALVTFRDGWHGFTYPEPQRGDEGSKEQARARVLQSEFHCMRGHVSDGTEIVCPSGKVATIRSGMKGWELRSESGDLLAAVGFDAMEVTRAVLELQ